MLQIKAKLLYNKKVKKNYFHCALEAAKFAGVACPGQFVNIKLTDTFDPFLRRPFSIHRVRGANNIEILYEVVGPATEIFAKKKAGEYLDIIGPLGNGFNYTLHATRYTLPVLVGGGMGVAPLIFLTEKLKKFETLVLIGAKTEKQILCEKEFRHLDCKVRISTDDGSKGFKGKVTELLEEILVARRTPHAARLKLRRLETCDLRHETIIYACGPRPMLKEISLFSQKYNIPAQISLEEHMACGIGACLGCVVNTKDGYKQVCKAGPVFDADKIIW